MYSQSVWLTCFCLVSILVATVDSKGKDVEWVPNGIRANKVKAETADYLVKLTTWGGNYLCTGTLLNLKYVVTSTRCLAAGNQKSIGNVYVVTVRSTERKEVGKIIPVGVVTVLKLKNPLGELLNNQPLLPAASVNLNQRVDIEIFGWGLTTNIRNLAIRANSIVMFRTKTLVCNGLPENFSAPFSRKLTAGCGDLGSPAFDKHFNLIGISTGQCAATDSRYESFINVSLLGEKIQAIISE